MREIRIQENEAGKRFDKFLSQYLSKASSGFIYKMLRKKNIVLNDKKADGKEKLEKGDVVKIYFSDDTFLKFANENIKAIESGKDVSTAAYEKAYRKLKNISIVFENHHILLVNKPEGVLTQKAEPSDISLNEWGIGYLLATNKIDSKSLTTFKPSICNRLDRNTSGIVIIAITLPGAQLMAKLLKERTLKKYYRTVVSGIIINKARIDGFLHKDEKTNTVSVSKEKNDDSSKIVTAYYPIKQNPKKNITYLEVELITGKTHQIRAHLSSIGHPLIGDYKYGIEEINTYFRSTYGIKSQMLHCFRVVFPKMPEGFEDLSEREFVSALPTKMNQVINEI